MSEVTPGWWWVKTLQGLSIVKVAPWDDDWDFVREQEDPLSTLAVWSIGSEMPHKIGSTHFVRKVDEPSDVQT